MKISINPSIFRDYDIRGTFPDQINEEVFFILGRAFAAYLDVDEIAVGHDMRLSSPVLFQSLIKGIITQGVNVVNLGLISTEMHYFASGKFGFPASLIVSASHNPANYNGLKAVKKGVIPLHGGNGLPQIKELAQKDDFSKATRLGNITQKNIMDEWIDHALSFIKIDNLKPLKIVIDAGNGMGGISWKKLTGKIPVKIIPLFFEPDGHFPNHLPDPLKKENLVGLQKEIIKNKADLGMAIDGDADRLFVLDDKGQVLSGTVVTALLAEALLAKYGPNPVLYNVVCGRIVPETIKRMKGTSIRVRVGHSFIKEYMKKYKAIFAGEHSGHFYFRDNFNADSSLITGLLILEYLSLKNQPLSLLTGRYNIYPSMDETNFRVGKIESMISLVEDRYDTGKTDHIDGLSVFYPDWWFNLRGSKTEPLLRLNIEADNELLLREKYKDISDLLIDNGACIT